MQSLASIAHSDKSPREVTATPSSPVSPSKSEAQLQDLIPIATVIVGGCETCAERMVTRALEQGSSWQNVDKTLWIIANMQRLDCFAKAVGADVVARMDKPLAAGQKTLQEAMIRTGQ